ncbi:hypothetical protein, partial [Proteus mirabilis]|uniref:hypothetical protein n=1 Tax=Proteus mirabilis TaxID=584 RepID=UPI001FD63A1F
AYQGRWVAGERPALPCNPFPVTAGDVPDETAPGAVYAAVPAHACPGRTGRFTAAGHPRRRRRRAQGPVAGRGKGRT